MQERTEPRAMAATATDTAAWSALEIAYQAFVRRIRRGCHPPHGPQLRLCAYFTAYITLDLAFQTE
jgi:hypothetical protein